MTTVENSPKDAFMTNSIQTFIISANTETLSDIIYYYVWS